MGDKALYNSTIPCDHDKKVISPITKNMSNMNSMDPIGWKVNGQGQCQWACIEILLWTNQQQVAWQGGTNVIGPCTVLYRPFLKHCTLTNTAVGTIWRALSKPPQRRQSPDLRPLLLLVGTPSAIRPELAFSRAEHSLPYSDVTIYIFAISYLSSMLYVTCIDFYDLSAWSGCWFDVYIRRFIYKLLNGCPFDYTAVAGSGKVGPVNQVNHTSWVAVVTPTDRPKSVRDRCLIELFCGVVCVVTLPFWHFHGCRGFCHRTESFFIFPFIFCLFQNSQWSKVKALDSTLPLPCHLLPGMAKDK